MQSVFLLFNKEKNIYCTYITKTNYFCAEIQRLQFTISRGLPDGKNKKNKINAHSTIGRLHKSCQKIYSISAEFRANSINISVRFHPSHFSPNTTIYLCVCVNIRFLYRKNFCPA